MAHWGLLRQINNNNNKHLLLLIKPMQVDQMYIVIFQQQRIKSTTVRGSMAVIQPVA